MKERLVCVHLVVIRNIQQMCRIIAGDACIRIESLNQMEPPMLEPRETTDLDPRNRK